MAIMQGISPTKLELTRLKRRLTTAIRGHKLLKDKRDDLMKKFLELVRHNKELRENVERRMSKVYGGFAVAGAVMSPQMLEEALMYPKKKVSLDISSANIMGVSAPKFTFKTEGPASDLYPYGFADTSGELDSSIAALDDVLPYLLELAQMEKNAQMLAEEIEKTRRRVNALEYVQIPDLRDTVRYISMKLDENERGNLARLMKIKDMMLEQQRNEAQDQY